MYDGRIEFMCTYSFYVNDFIGRIVWRYDIIRVDTAIKTSSEDVVYVFFLFSKNICNQCK